MRDGSGKTSKTDFNRYLEYLYVKYDMDKTKTSSRNDCIRGGRISIDLATRL